MTSVLCTPPIFLDSLLRGPYPEKGKALFSGTELFRFTRHLLFDICVEPPLMALGHAAWATRQPLSEGSHSVQGRW